MKKHIKGENGLTYTLGEDGCYYPDLVMSEGQGRPVGRFGRIHLEYHQGIQKRLLCG